MENKQTYKQKHHINFYYNFAAGVLKKRQLWCNFFRMEAAAEQ